jgi:hypothetical protein
MAKSCFKKKDSNPPVCGVHKVPLVNAKLPYELLTTGLKDITFLVCPVSGEVLTDGAPNRLNILPMSKTGLRETFCTGHNI